MATIFFASAGCSLEVIAQLFVDQRLDDTLDFAVAELGLGLSLELRLGNFDADDRGQALAHIVALQILVVFLELAAAHAHSC